jgi:UDP-4-amino-4-deoxy-L-arabinose-oxoglutarate aminotransferase
MGGSVAFIPFCRHKFDSEEEAAVLSTLRSSWVTSGPVTKGFEADFSAYTGAPHSLAVSSGTAGLFMACQALGIKADDEVVVPAMTWPATANAPAILGARPVFADVDYATLCVTRETIAARITERTKAVMIVHFAGLACDLDPIVDLCRERGIPLLEDSAHAVGTRYRGRHVGGDYAAASVYSFHPIKNMTTGEGGMITCHQQELQERLTLFRFHGIKRDAWSAYGKGSAPLYDLSFPALKFNATDILSAIGQVQLRKLDGFIQRRTKIARMYLTAFSDCAGLDLPVDDNGHAWHLFIVKLNNRAGMNRATFMQRLKEEWNIGTGIHFLPVNRMSYYREGADATPEAFRIGDSCVSLPLYPSMSSEDIARVIKAVRHLLEVAE